MARRILLIEPNYKNKYPPMGLMKISTYHKRLGDEVRFYKGEFIDFVLEQIYEELLEKLTANDDAVNWTEYKEDIVKYIKTGLAARYTKLIEFSKSALVGENLKYYRRYFNRKEYLEDPKWDRVCISTLFTFYWEKTIDTINFFKHLCKSSSEVKVGGVAATLLPNEIEKETGIRPHVGLLDKGGEYDANNTTIIDHLPLDYSILNEIDYVYPENNGYYAYMTRGCVNQCPFCAVPQLEPGYDDFVSIKDQIRYIADTFGEKRNLLLLDNNVLASERFGDIIDEIKECDFRVGATYVEPNKYLVLISDMKRLTINYRGHIKSIVTLYKWLYKKADNESKSKIYAILHENKLLSTDTATKETILSVDDFFAPLFEKYHNKTPKARYVDFNQGVDARLLTPEKMKKLAEIPIRPLRIAFDSWSLRGKYEAAVRLAASNGIRHMSNYLLYNYNEKPIDLYRRLKLNVDLCEELDVIIYSFPMKYHPIQDQEYFRNRTFIGKHWNRKFIRCIQAILNSTKGKVGRGKSFFEKAFGCNAGEYEKLLYMPEVMIIYRLYYEDSGITDAWWKSFSALSQEKLEFIKPIIHENDFSNIKTLTSDQEILNVLEYYTITRNDAEEALNALEERVD